MLSKVAPDLEKIVEHFGIPSMVGIVILPFAIPVVVSFGKSLTKTSIKGGIILYEKSKEAIATVSEKLAEIIAETKTELAVIDHTSLRRSR